MDRAMHLISDQQRLLTKRLYDSEPNGDQLSGAVTTRVSHGGTVSPEFSTFLLKRLFFIDFTDGRIIDMGSGSGQFVHTASILASRGNFIHGVEVDVDRHQRSRDWHNRFMNSLNDTRNINLNDVEFIRDDFNEFPQLTQWKNMGMPLLLFCNNYNGCWNADDTQSKFEDRMSDAPHNSVVVGLDKLFPHNLTWHQEVFSTRIPPEDVSWLGCRDSDGLTEIKIYKYTKAVAPEEGLRDIRFRTRNIIHIGYPYATHDILGNERIRHPRPTY